MTWVSLIKFFFTNQNSIMVVCFIATLINIILTVILYRELKNSVYFKNKINNPDNKYSEDESEEKSNLKFLNASFIYYFQILISLIFLLILVIGNIKDIYVLFAIIPYMITVIPALLIGLYARKVDERYPKLGEHKYTEKLLSIMDEGERHITLTSMFKTYHINLVLIIVFAIFLAIHSISSGINQTMGVIFLIVLFIYNAFGYLSKVRKFYKS
ncbi:DUF3169 family protein [Staphylococcus pasteuri]